MLPVAAVLLADAATEAGGATGATAATVASEEAGMVETADAAGWAVCVCEAGVDTAGVLG